MTTRLVTDSEIDILLDEIDILKKKVLVLRSTFREYRPEKVHLPEVFISSEEACRLLDVTNKTLLSIVSTDMLKTTENRAGKRDKFLLSEVVWLQSQPYRNANSHRVKQILKAKEIAHFN